MSLQGLEQVKKFITGEYERRKVKLYALALSYAGQALNKARSERRWTDRTNQARDRLIARAFIDKNDIGFLLAHGVEYGLYLELANDRQYEIIRPVIDELGDKFIKDARELF